MMHPRRFRSDPAGVKGIERKMMTQLNTLVVRFSSAVKKMTPDVQPRGLESPYMPILGHFDNGRWVPDTGAIMQAVRDAAEREIYIPGKELASDIVHTSFRHGSTFADREVAYIQRLPPPTELKIGGGFSPADLKIIDTLYQNNLVEIKGVSDELAKRMNRVLLDGMAKGDGIREIARRIDDVTEFGKNRSVTIARTEVMFAVNTSARARIESAGYSRLERVESEDEKTCTDFQFNVGGTIYNGCAAINGKIFTFEEAAEIDRQSHPNCRGTWIPAMTAEEATAAEA